MTNKIVQGVLLKYDLSTIEGVYEISADVTAISETAFSNTDGVTTIIIHNKLYNLKASVFDAFRNLEEFQVVEDHPVYTVQDGIIFNKDMSEILFVPANLQKETYCVPDTVKEIHTAFAKCTGIRNLILGKNITKLCKYSISEWEYNAKRIVTIPSNVQEIHEDALRFRPNEVIECIKGMSGSVADKFAKRNQIPFFEMNDDMDEFTLEQLKTYRIEENDTGVTLLKYLGNDKILELPEYILGKKLTTIGAYAFQTEDWAEARFDSITIPQTVSGLDENAFGFVYIEKLTIPASVTYIHDNCFGEYDFYIENATIIVDRDSAIDKYLSEKKPGLIKRYTEEGDSSNIESLKCLDFSEMSDGTLCAKYTSKYDVKPVTELLIPEKFNGKEVRVVDFNSYLDGAVKTIYLPKTVTSLELSQYQFASGLENIVIAEDNEGYWTDGKGIYSKDRSTFLRLCDFSLSEYTIAKGTRIIETYAFASCEKLERLILPETICEIKELAFNTGYNGCEKLTEIVNIDLVTKMDPKALLGIGLLYSQKEVIVGNALMKYQGTDVNLYEVLEGIVTIGAEAFSVQNQDDILQEVILPDSIINIGEGAFRNRKKLKKIILPEGIKVLPQELFCGCHSLESIYIPKTVDDISQTAFPKNHVNYNGTIIENCAFKEIVVDLDNANYTSVAGILYSKDMKRLTYCPMNLEETNIEIPEGVEIICDSAFKGNVNITSVDLPETISVIESNAFHGCSNLGKINLSEVKCIDTYAFSNCSKLTFVELSKELDTLETSVFENCGFEKIDIPNGVRCIKAQAFADCNLKKIVIPKSVKIVEHEAFSGCRDITIYNTIEPDGKDCYSMIDNLNGYPNSEIGFMGIGQSRAMWQCAANHTWLNHVITVRSAENEEILYKVFMEADSTQRQYYSILTSGWGHHGTFAFEEVDKFFDKIKGADYKLKLALSRLQYKIDLSSDYEKKYTAYIARNGKAALKMCIDDEDYELLQLCADLGAIKKGNIDEIIKYSNARKSVLMTAFLLEYKNMHFKAK